MSFEAPARFRWTWSLLLAALVHVGVVAVLALQLPVAHAAPHVADPTTPHPGVLDPVGPSDPYVDLTPPEVRQLGGPTLLEVLEATPTAQVPDGVRPEHEARAVVDLDAPGLRPDEVRSGRAPPVG